MFKKRKNSFFGWNYTVVVAFFILIAVLLPIVLYWFEWENYVEDKQRSLKEIQVDVNEKLSTVKDVLNYTFYDDEFQTLLQGVLLEGWQGETDKIYERLTISNFMGDTIKNVIYFPLVSGNVNSDLFISSTDTLLAFIPQLAGVVKSEFNDSKYYGGEYFSFTIDTKFNKNEPESFIIGHFVLGASFENYLKPIGVCLAVINLPSLTDVFSIATEGESEAVKIGLYTNVGSVIYGEGVREESELDSQAVYKMEINFKSFPIKCILYFGIFQVFYNFLPYLVSIILIMLFLLLVFFIYLRLEEKKKTAIYENFILTFRKISEGQVENRVGKYNIEELDLVGEQFNLMMDSILLLNRKLGEEEIRALNSEKEKDRYILKYLSTQINKHFIFNTFGVIRSFVNREKNQEASNCIDLLCNYLRFTFKGKDFVSVGEEIKSLSDYLDIQKIRLSDIHVTVNVDSAIKDMQIPQFILQPVVENAYKHAFTRNRGKILVEGRLVGDMIEFSVTDDGVGIDADRLKQLTEILSANQETSSDGEIGLINVQRRVKILTGENACVMVESERDKGTKIIIRCGKRMEENA